MNTHIIQVDGLDEIEGELFERLVQDGTPMEVAAAVAEGVSRDVKARVELTIRLKIAEQKVKTLWIWLAAMSTWSLIVALGPPLINLLRG